MSHNRIRYLLNAPGPFYVEDGCCALCGVPGVTAPHLFGGFGPDGSVLDGVGHCWVKRQPTSSEELDAMIETMARQELNCIRYSGADTNILARLSSIGEGDQID